MKRLFASLVIGTLACAIPEPPPEIRRDAPPFGTEPHGPPPDITRAEDSDAGPPELDAGVCCPVLFRLDAQTDEAAGELKFIDEAVSFPLELDGGVWSVTACRALRTGRYYFELGLTGAESDDGGLFHVTRVNANVPSEVNATAGVVNVLQPGAAMTCAEFDGGMHGQLADGG